MVTEYDVKEVHADYVDDYGVPVSFTFPNLCCRCLAPSPDKEWQIANGKQVGNVSVSFLANVPVCEACHSQLTKARSKVGLVTIALMLSILAALVISDPFELNNTAPKDMAGGYGLIGLCLMIGGIVGYVALDWIMVPRDLRRIADLSKDGDRIAFHNQEYQQLYLRHNQVSSF